MTLGYGLTEASPETHDSPPGRIREGTVGIPIVDTDAEVRDLETGKEVPPGKPGELLIRGPQVTRFGYLGDEDETGRILKNGWLHTGDIAIMDQEGYFKLVDRKKDIVKCKGYTIYPVELEDVLYKHPGVKECAVVGKKHPEYGEIPKAFVIKKSGADLTPKELLSFCERRVSPLKRLREIEFTDDIPKTHVGKVLRRKLRTDE
jgi:long-chain acyl-CoA synthetase